MMTDNDMSLGQLINASVIQNDNNNYYPSGMTNGGGNSMRQDEILS